MVVVAPDPVMLPGLIVQLPEGNPVNTTLPVARVQVGCTTLLKTGGAGTVFISRNTSKKEDTQPLISVTLPVNL